MIHAGDPVWLAVLHCGGSQKMQLLIVTRISSKLNRARASVVVDVLQVQLLVLFALSVKVDADDLACDLTEADVVESLETSAGYGPDSVVGHKEMLLPSHEEIFSLGKVLVCKVGTFGLLGQGAPGREPAPVLHVNLFVGPPLWPVGLKSVLCANDFAFKVGCEGRVVIGQSLYPEIATQTVLFHVDIFDLHLNLVHLSIGLLCAFELAAGLEEGRR